MERRFACIACGKCCHGWLPLTLADALAHAGRFPLAIIWSPIRQGSKAFGITAKLGLTLTVKGHKPLAVRITPTAYLPPALPCPALTADGLCAIHDSKPQRCRTMPFFPWQEERDQGENLIPRPGWLCETKGEAPVVYRDRAIIERQDFERERATLLAEAPLLRSYAEAVVKAAPGIAQAVAISASKPGGGHVPLKISPLLMRLDGIDRAEIAAQQIAVLTTYAERVADRPELAEYRRTWTLWAKDLERLLIIKTPAFGDIKTPAFGDQGATLDPPGA
ncbi:YkgJ family cysteine cluster protein [uncultured Gammaproteobacteria bacterium]